MSDTRDHTTRDQLADLLRDLGAIYQNGGTYTDAADALLASDAIAAVRAAAVAETTAAIETVLRDKEREAQPLSQSVNPVAAGEASGIHMTTHAVRAALSGGRTALDTTLAQARADAVEQAAQDFPLTPNITLTGVRICEMLHARAARLRADTGADQ